MSELAHSSFVPSGHDNDAVILPFPSRQVFEVDKADLQSFAQHTQWTQILVNYLYEHGDHSDRSIPKESTVLSWQGDTFRVSAGGLDRFAQTRLHPDEFRHSIRFAMEQTTASGVSKLAMEIDPRGRPRHSRYAWEGEKFGRPAPDAEFDGVYEAHAKKVTKYGAGMLALFRQAALSHRGSGVQGLWRQTPLVLPESLRQLPVFVSTD